MKTYIFIEYKILFINIFSTKTKNIEFCKNAILGNKAFRNLLYKIKGYSNHLTHITLFTMNPIKS